MTVIGHASVDIRANDRFFEKDVRKIAKGIKDVTIDVKADVDLSKVNKKLRDLRSRNKLNTLEIFVDVNTSKFDKKMEKLWNSYDGQNIDVGFSQTGLDKIERQLQEIKNLSNRRVRLGVDIDEASIREALEGSEATIHVSADTDRASLELDEASRPRETTIIADANTIGAASQLAWAARDREAKISAHIDPKTIAGLKGYAYAFTGSIPFASVRDSIAGIGANFESLSAKVGIASTGIMGAGSALTSFVGDALAISGDITKVVGLLAAAPAGMALGATAITALTLGWKGFGKAVGGDAKALAALPPQAQAAAKGIKGVGTAMRQEVQRSYWEELGTSLQDTIQMIKGPLTQGLMGAGKAMGEQTNALLAQFRQFTQTGALDETFKNINSAISKGAKAMTGFSKGFLNFLEGGSKSLPRFGDWIGKIGTQFGNWAENANKTGQITVWINQAVDSLKNLWTIGSSTVKIFSGLTEAARNAGMNGLPELADGFQKVADVINGPAFQKNMTSIFLSARKSMENMAPGMAAFFNTIKDGVPTIGKAMEISGQTVGQLFQNIAGMFDGTGLGQGFLTLLTGMRDAMKTLEPGFRNLGSLLGNVFEIMAAVTKETAPGLNQLFDALDQVVAGLKDGLVAAIPVFNDFIQSILLVLKSVVVPIAQGFGKLLEVFSALPQPIRDLILAFSTLLLLKGKFGKFFSGISQGMKGVSRELAQTAADTEAAVARTARATGGSSAAKALQGTALNTARATSKATEQALKDSAARNLKLLQTQSKTQIREAQKAGKEQVKQAKIAGNAMVAQAKADQKFANQAIRAGILERNSQEVRLADRRVADAKMAAQRLKNDAVKYSKETTAAVKNDFKQRLVDSEAYNKSVQRGQTAGRTSSLSSINNSLKSKTLTTAGAVTPSVNLKSLQAGLKQAESAVSGSTSRMSRAMTTGMSRVNLGNSFATGVTRAMAQAEAAAVSGSARIARSAETSLNRLPAVAGRAGRATGRNLSASITSATRDLNLTPLQARVVNTLSTVKAQAANAASAIKRSAAEINTAFSTIGTSVSGAQGFAGKSKAAFSGVGKAAKASGSLVTKGLGTAIGGLVGVMGGPWGLALAGGIAAISAFGQASEDAKAQVAGLKDTLSSTGKMTAQSASWFEEDIAADKGDWMDKGAAFLTGHMGGADVQKALEKTGQSLGDASTMIARNGSEYLSTWNDFKQKLGTQGSDISNLNGKEFLDQFNISDEQLYKIGQTRESFSQLNNVELSNVAAKMADLYKKTDQARKGVEATKKSYQDLSTLQLASNTSVLQDINSSVEDKLSAFKSNMQLGGLEDLSGQAGLYNLGTVTEQNTSKLAELQGVAKKAGIQLKDTFSSKNVNFSYIQDGVKKTGQKTIAMFDMQSQAGRGMYDVMRTQADAIHQATISTYDATLKSTGDVSKAQSEAMKSAKTQVTDFKAQLMKAGITDTKTLNTLMDTAGLSDKDIKIALTTEGMDTAITQAQAVQQALDAMKTGDYSVYLKVMDDEAKGKIQELLGLGKNFSTEDFQLKIRAAFDNEEQYNAWMQKFAAAKNDDVRVQMIMELTGADKVMSTVNEATKKTKDFDGTTFMATIETVSKSVGKTPEQITALLKQIPDKQLKSIIVEAETKGISLKEIFTQIGSLSNKQVKVVVEAIKAGKDPIQALKNEAAKGVDVATRAKKSGKSASEAVDDKKSVSVSAIAKATKTAEEAVKAGANSVEVAVKPTVQGSVNAAIRGGLAFGEAAQKVNVGVKVTGQDQIASLQTLVGSLNNKSVKINVSANTKTIGSVRTAMDSVKNKSVKVNVSANSKSINNVKSAMNSVKNKSVKVSVSASAGQVNSAKKAVDGIKNKSVKVSVSASTGSVKSLQSAINGVKAKTVKIKADAGAALSAVKRVNGASIKAKTLTIRGNAGPALSAIARVNSARVSNKTQTITTIHRTVNKSDNANGGMYMAGVRTFANGGKLDPRALKAMQSFKGGSENHRAQISKSATKFRIWGEPETGGEAYIPLSKAKRARSLKILDQVAAHFGLSLSQQFSNGGFLSGNTVGNITSFASGGTSAATKKKTTAAQKKVSDARKKAADKAKDAFSKFKDLIKDMKTSFSQGFSDIRKAFGASEKSPVQSAISSMKSSVSKFISTYKKDPKRSKQVKAAEKMSKTLSKQYASSTVWNKKSLKFAETDFKTGKTSKVKADSTYDTARVIAQDSIRRQKTRAKDYNSSYTLRDYERSIAYVDKMLDSAKAKYEKLVDSSASLKSSIAGGLYNAMNLGSIVNEKNSLGWRAPTSAKDVSSYLTGLRSDMAKFSKNISAMKKAGYNAALIAEIAGMDMESGIAISDALLKDKSQLKTINKAFTDMYGAKGQYNIDSSGNSYVGGSAYYFGRDVSDGIFKSSITTQKAIKTSLEKEKSALEKSGQAYSNALQKIGKQMMDGLAKGITSNSFIINSVVKKVIDKIPATIRKKLKIKSPSRVMADLGQYIPQGLAMGIDKNKSAVDKSMSNMVDTQRVDLSVPKHSTLVGQYANAAGSGIMDSRQQNAPTPININVSPSQGLSEEQVGKIAARELLYRLDSATL